jgi:NitT/TauT family transport system permease protein
MASFLRALAGLTAGFIMALGLGVIVSLSKVASNLIVPLLQLCAPISPVAWIPFSIVLFGVGDLSAVFIVFIGIVFLLTLATVSAIRNVDVGLLKAAGVLGAGRHQQWRYIIIPAILPQVFTLLRTNFFAAWMAVLAAEMVGTKNGLGAIILIGRESFNPSLILLGMTIIGLCGWFIDSLLAVIQHRLFWWQASSVN